MNYVRFSDRVCAIGFVHLGSAVGCPGIPGEGGGTTRPVGSIRGVGPTGKVETDCRPLAPGVSTMALSVP